MASSDTFYPDWRDKVVYHDDGPNPTPLMDTDRLKVVVVGIKAGQVVPHHPTNEAMYHILAGSGTMTVGDESFPVSAGATVVVRADVDRGLTADTDIVFLGTRAMKPKDTGN